MQRAQLSSGIFKGLKLYEKKGCSKQNILFNILSIGIKPAYRANSRERDIYA